MVDVDPRRSPQQLHHLWPSWDAIQRGVVPSPFASLISIPVAASSSFHHLRMVIVGRPVGWCVPYLVFPVDVDPRRRQQQLRHLDVANVRRHPEWRVPNLVCRVDVDFRRRQQQLHHLDVAFLGRPEERRHPRIVRAVDVDPRRRQQQLHHICAGIHGCPPQCRPPIHVRLVNGDAWGLHKRPHPFGKFLCGRPTRGVGSQPASPAPSCPFLAYAPSVIPSAPPQVPSPSKTWRTGEGTRRQGTRHGAKRRGVTSPPKP